MDISEFLETEFWQAWNEENRSCGGAGMILSDPARFDRCWDAAESGAEGSTHGEIIDDWRRAARSAWLREVLTDGDYEELTGDIDACEAWHEKNGSLDVEVG